MGEIFAGRFELIDLIGEGGMGTVWRAWDARTEQMVAAKVLRQSDAATLLRFVREQSVRIHHPHVVVPLSWAGEDDRVLFTMPLVTGGSVANLVQDFGPLPPLVVAEILRQLLDGLSAVHDAGLVHRDIKPANLLLDPTGTGRPHVWLSDFGISIDLNRPRWTETGVVSGTPGYLAPELERFGAVTPSVDLYAAGQVGLTMLLGVRPSQRADEGLTQESCPAHVPVALWSALVALTAPEPVARPQDARAAAALLAAPDLVWREGAMGEVEVFQHLSDAVGLAPMPVPEVQPMQAPVPVQDVAAPPEPAEDEEVTVRRASAQVTPTPVLPPDEGAPGASEGIPSWLPMVGLVAAALLGIVLIWSPWSADKPESNPSGTTTPSSTSGTTPATPTSSTASTTPSNAPVVTPTATRGTVDIGTVVTSVGQPCEFSEVGIAEQTVTGVGVVCTQRSDGSYAWLQR